MQIRAQQVAALDDSAKKAFFQRMLGRIAEYFPKHAKFLPEPQQRTVVQAAWDRAIARGFTAERSVGLYLDLTLLLGIGFDADPLLGWVGPILNDASITTQADRIDQLHARGWQFAQQASGDFADLLEKGESAALFTAMNEIRNKDTNELTPDQAKTLAYEISARLPVLFPIKMELCGAEQVRAVVLQAFDTARRHGIRNARGIYLFSALMVVVGASFDVDPQLPWASRVLLDPAIGSPAERTKKLHLEAVRCLQQWWNIDATGRG